MTSLNVIVNKVDGNVDYQTTPANFVVLSLIQDYLIWSAGSAAVADGQDEPTPAELNEAATLIDPVSPVEVARCLVFDKDEGLGTLREINGMNENKRFVFGFSFNGATATEPQLEAWDDTGHDSTNKHVLGAGTPVNSMVKAVCTTNTSPGAGWVGTALAGANALLLNDGNGALGALPSGVVSQELYANLKIRIPADYATPGAETWILTVRFSWN